MNETARAAAALAGGRARSARRLHGGDLAEVLAVDLESGGQVVAKPGATARAEARMLEAIAAAGAPAPRVVAVRDDLLVLEMLETGGSLGGPGGGAWASLGAALRRLHAVTGPEYGWEEDHRFGAVAIPNAPRAPWPAFWAERRLLPSVREVPHALGVRIERLARRLPELLPEAPPPALLHGDLWAGNVLVSGGRVTGLIDPACYRGHAEVDLAMLSLFASPGAAFREAYGPAEPGFAARQPVYQLWPALVHLRLFGGGYAGLVSGLLGAAGA